MQNSVILAILFILEKQRLQSQVGGASCIDRFPLWKEHIALDLTGEEL